MSETQGAKPYAVRWAHGYYGDSIDFTTWHYARPSAPQDWTGCGRVVPRVDSVMEFEVMPIRFTACKQCKARREVKEALKGEA